jgi:MFS family permease
MSAHAEDLRTIETDIPARLDRLPWSRWHWMIVIGLGTVWILDGLEVTIVGSIAGRLTEKGSGISLSESQIGQAAAFYVAGACLGALFFGRLTDKFGRKNLFMITLCVYLAATVATAFAGSFLFFAICRFFTGAGIGGEYAAINSAIDELIPARVRGTVDLIINGSFWFGAALGGALALALLDTDIFAPDLGWRLAFGFGAVLGLAVLLVRRSVPESARWLIMHGREDEAEAIVRDVEEQVRKSSGKELPDFDGKKIKIKTRGTISFTKVARTMFGQYRQRAVVGFGLFIGQAFLYNAIFFTYALVLTTFYDVKDSTVPIYIIPFAVGNLMGPLLLGRLFDTVGRKPMIAGSYILSGLGLLVTAYLFKQGVLTATTQTIAWCVIFFFASAGASAAYLTVSEIFPMETRAMAIAFFFAIGTAIGGIVGPLLFGNLIETERETPVFWGYVLGASLMIVGGIIQAIWGVKAERRSLEDVALPVSAEEAGEDGFEGGTDGAAPRDGRRTGRFTRTPAPIDSPQAATAVLAGAKRPIGPSESQAMYSPQQVVGERSATDPDVDREVDELVDVLSTRGELTRRELGALAETTAWGPGRFGRALELGVLSGRIRRTGRDRYAAGS